MRASLACFCLAFASLGCEKVLGEDFDDVAPLQASSSDSGAACPLALPNPPPQLNNTGGDAVATLVATTIEWGEASSDFGKKPPEFGFDLDGLCSNHGDPPPCLPYAYTGGDPTDGPHGEDNSVSKMIGTQWTALGLSDPPLTTQSSAIAIKEGRFSPLLVIRITNWIGGYDDEDITVEWFVPLPANDGPGGAFVPKLDGTDTWPLLADVPGGSEPARFTSEKAYVSGQKFVARFKEARLPLTTAYLKVNDIVMTGDVKLDPVSQIWELKSGLVAGWSDSYEIVRQLPTFTSALLGFPLCTNISTYHQQIKPWLCGAADTLLPDKKPGDACDGISFGIGFDGIQVALGEAGDEKPSQSCPAQFDPANDRCSIPVEKP